MAGKDALRGRSETGQKNTPPTQNDGNMITDENARTQKETHDT